MVEQCTECRRIRVDGFFRLPWPGELDDDITEIFCPRCAREKLQRIKSGEFIRDLIVDGKRQTANS